MLNGRRSAAARSSARHKLQRMQVTQPSVLPSAEGIFVLLCKALLYMCAPMLYILLID